MLFSAINAEYPPFTGELHPHELSAVQHELMARSRRNGFVARVQDLQVLHDYVCGSSSSNSSKSLLISGQPGVGKSALVSQFVNELHEMENVDVVSFYLGANFDSYDLHEILLYLIHELDKVLV